MINYDVYEDYVTDINFIDADEYQDAFNDVMTYEDDLFYMIEQINDSLKYIGDSSEQLAEHADAAITALKNFVKAYKGV